MEDAIYLIEFNTWPVGNKMFDKSVGWINIDSYYRDNNSCDGAITVII